MSDQFKRLSKVLARSFSINEDALQSCFRVADIEEISKISTLRRHVFGNDIRHNDELYLKWRYFDSESYTSTLWVFEFDNNIIAALGTEPVELWLNGETIKALRNMDAIVDPQYNNRGLGAWMTLAMQSTNDCILVTGGNKNSASMLGKLFTALSVRKNYKIILHSQYFLRNKINNEFLIKILSPFVDGFLAFILNMKLVSIKQANNWEMKRYDDVSSLLPHIKERSGLLGKVKVFRSEPHLKWRYSENPVSEFQVLALFDERNCLGYIIYTCPDTDDGRAMQAFIMDWDVFKESIKSQILAVMFKAVIKELKNSGIDEINVELNDNDSINTMRETGFIFRFEDPNFYVFHKYLPTDSVLFSAGDWYHSLGDSDNI